MNYFSNMRLLFAKKNEQFYATIDRLDQRFGTLFGAKAA